MGTRSMILFHDHKDQYIYRHYDGYPEGEHGVLSMLMPILRSGTFTPFEEVLNAGNYELLSLWDEIIMHIEYAYSVEPEKVLVYDTAAWRHTESRLENAALIQVVPYTGAGAAPKG